MRVVIAPFPETSAPQDLLAPTTDSLTHPGDLAECLAVSLSDFSGLVNLFDPDLCSS